MQEAHGDDSKPNSPVHGPNKTRLLTGKREGEEKEVKKDKGVKRKRRDEGQSRKRQKKKESDDEDVSGLEEQDRSSPRNERRRTASTLSPPPTTEVKKGQVSSPAEFDTNGAEPEQSESEMSVLIDEPPKKGRSRGRLKEAESTKRGKEHNQPAAKNQKRKSHADETADPNQEEIKRLQSWLVKCGIRKMWWKELQPFETARAKIAHLKDMLAEAGMVGRYSQEKAAHIREERELKADLEAVQEGARIWGKEDEEDACGGNDGSGRLKKQVAKGLQGLDFLNDDDGEETD